MLQKAIFGGTFDPIHLGHLNLAETALKSLKLSKIIFMPAGNPPFKSNKIVTDAKLRYELVKIAIKNNPLFEVSDYELQDESYSYTYKTLEFFKNREPSTKWFFLTGMDCLFQIDKWKYPERIFKAAEIIIFNRDGYKIEEIEKQKYYIEQKYETEVTIINMKLYKVSSTEIRKNIKLGNACKNLLPSDVYKKIIELNLYNA